MSISFSFQATYLGSSVTETIKKAKSDSGQYIMAKLVTKK
jgi:hypothetical protein